MKYTKIPHETVDKIFALYEPSQELLAVISQDHTPHQLIELAREEELYADLVQFLAHALPKRESIWWAVCCASTKTK